MTTKTSFCAPRRAIRAMDAVAVNPTPTILARYRCHHGHAVVIEPEFEMRVPCGVSMFTPSGKPSKKARPRMLPRYWGPRCEAPGCLSNCVRYEATIKGIVTSTECTSSCRAAESDHCECACGGRQHGVKYAPAVIGSKTIMVEEFE